MCVKDFDEFERLMCSDASMEADSAQFQHFVAQSAHESGDDVDEATLLAASVVARQTCLDVLRRYHEWLQMP